MALTDGLVSWWSLDESSGNAIDSHGANTLTDINTVGVATGVVSGARDFERGNAEAFEIASNATLQTGDIDFSFAGWLKMESNVLMFAFSKGGVVASTREYGLYTSTDRILRFFVVDSSSVAATATAAAATPLATWVFVYCYHDSASNVVGISINNGTAVTSAHSTGVRTGTFKFELGARQDQSAWWDGCLDEWAFWKRLLTPTELAEIYNSGVGITYPGYGYTRRQQRSQQIIN